LQVAVEAGRTTVAVVAQVVIGRVWSEPQTVEVEAQHQFCLFLPEWHIPSPLAQVALL
jgi:hypothetical protein